MADTPQYPTARQRQPQPQSRAGGANLGFEEKLWLIADKLRGLALRNARTGLK